MNNKLFFFVSIILVIAFPISGIGKGKCLNKRFYTNLNYDVLATNRIIIKNVRVNNSEQTFNFLLDSGSSKSIISPSVINLLNIEIAEKEGVSDGIKRTEMQLAKVEFSIDGIIFSNIEAFIKESSMPDTKCTIDGIIGFNLMKLCCWSFNLLDSSIIIANSVDDFEQIDLYYKQYFKYIWGGPYVMCNIGENFYSSDMLFDLGSNTKVTIGNLNDVPKYFKNKMPYIQSKGYAVQRSFSTTIDTSMGFEVVQIDKFHFGKSLRKKNMNSENYISNIAGYLDEEDEDDVIGAEILKEYALILDGPKQKFYSRIMRGDSGFTTAGIGILPSDDYYLVATVWENSSAMDNGIIAGDTILIINNMSLRDSNLSSCDLYLSVLEEVSRHDSVHVTLLRNNEIINKVLIQKDLFE